MSAAVTASKREDVEANALLLLHPAGYAPELARVVFHEAVHFWQHIGSSYLSALAGEDYARLIAFEARGETVRPGPLRTTFMAAHVGAGFSARDLHEALARYWDVHVIGPSRLLEQEFANPARSFDEEFIAEYWGLKEHGQIVHPETGGYSQLAYRMAMGAAAGNYARPYLDTIERLGIAGDIVFPLAGYFAFQTSEPVPVFLHVINSIGPHLTPAERGQAIHDLWRAAFRPVARTAGLYARDRGWQLQNIGLHAYEDGALADHPVWSALARLRLPAALGWLDRPPYPLDDAPSSDSVRALSILEYVLACPGDPDYREGLVAGLSPPLFRFDDDSTWPYAAVVANQYGDGDLAQVMTHLAAESSKLRQRWEAFLFAVRGY